MFESIFLYDSFLLNQLQMLAPEEILCCIQTRFPFTLVVTSNPIHHSIKREVTQQKTTVLKPKPQCPSEREINILLLGQTGVGKSTFINAFVNYITNDTLEQAVNDEMQAVIPSSFAFTDPGTFAERMIVVGDEDKYERFGRMGECHTRQCRSFIFPIGDRNLRFIDTPGIGDTRGLKQDARNFQEILTYTAQYEHLNAVFYPFNTQSRTFYGQ